MVFRDWRPCSSRAPATSATPSPPRRGSPTRGSSGTRRPTSRASTRSSSPAASPTATTCAPARSPASPRRWSAVPSSPTRGGPVLGICNGFQVLCEAGLLPGALLANEGLRFLCRQVELEVVNAETAATGECEAGERLSIPVKHMSGRWFAPPDQLAELERAGQIVFRYARRAEPERLDRRRRRRRQRARQRRRADAASRARRRSAHRLGRRAEAVPLAEPGSRTGVSPRGRGRDLPPAPFVVGVGRSGTTLLRLMLDAHPRAGDPTRDAVPARADRERRRPRGRRSAPGPGRTSASTRRPCARGSAARERPVRSRAPSTPSTPSARASRAGARRPRRTSAT